MATIGAEVGQKMRSAIKAKLLELNCYVDDELPDYVMVMVANKRTKSQMKEDLQLFLNTKTATFVDWLHIVLKKLKEVTVTNPEVYKKTAKRKPEDADIKKEKKDKKARKNDDDSSFKSLTDDLPINANKLSEQRKIIIMKENQSNNSTDQDSFDIPLLSEVNMSTEEELEDIERKIKGVKSRLGLIMASDNEDEGDCINLKPEPDELLETEDKSKDGQSSRNKRTIEVIQEKNIPAEEVQKPERTRITFDETTSAFRSPNKRRSILERLGRRRSYEDDFRAKRSRRSEEESRRSSGRIDRKRDEPRRSSRRERDKPKEVSVMSRLGVMSKISIPQKPPEEPEEPLKDREVPSVVKIKPRILPPEVQQPNKNLLLKAVADAQRSIAQTPKVGKEKSDAVYSKNYKSDVLTKTNKGRKLSKSQKDKLAKLLLKEVEMESLDYVPEPITKKNEESPKYVPSTPDTDSSGSKEVKHQFIVTLDGLEKSKFKLKEKPSIKSRLDRKKSPSPIIFDKPVAPSKAKIHDKLSLVQAPPLVKNKERCRYWPQCRQGDKCEFVHPSTLCDKFPHCKFGDKCLYLHPSCKFGSSCTRRDCPYSHSLSPANATANVKQICKYFPNCVNSACTFLHAKPCKFGKYCKNLKDCNFSHGSVPNKSSLTWRSK